MRTTIPKPFTFEGGKRAVLLLHGFTGNSADVRMLGRYLEDKGYTCHAPHYKGHAVPPEELVKTGPKDWWKDVMMGYDFLKRKGHEEIAVAGLSLGGVFSLKLGYTVPIKGIVPMCAPMYFKSKEQMYQGVLDYAKEYKKREGKSKEQIEAEMKKFAPMDTLESLQRLIASVRENVHNIDVPTLVVQGSLDTVINPDSANIIYDSLKQAQKEIKWYERSGHVITLDKEKEQLHKDVYEFLEQLDWKE
ncbi:MAG: alpha/beta hydrolase [Bacillus sp. (in: firmicutes)]